MPLYFRIRKNLITWRPLLQKKIFGLTSMTRILYRDASINFLIFDQNDVEYEMGFRNRNGEHWLGLKTLHQLTTFLCTELRIDMETTVAQNM